MTKRVEVKTEMTAEMLYERYRKAKDPVERTHWSWAKQTHGAPPVQGWVAYQPQAQRSRGDPSRVSATLLARGATGRTLVATQQ